MKKVLNLFIGIFAIMLFLLVSGETSHASSEPYYVHERMNYLLVDVNEALSLEQVIYRGYLGDIPLSEGEVVSSNNEVTIENHQLKVSKAGLYPLTFKYAGFQYPLYLLAKDAEENSYLLYEEDFLNLNELPDGFRVVQGKVSIVDGTLFLEGREQQTTIVLLPEYLDDLTNYVIEVDFTIREVLNESRWASVMFRYEPGNYYQMAIRKNATLSNGVEFAKAINNVWNVPATTAYTEQINGEKWYRLKIEVFNNTVHEYINGTLMVTYELATEYEKGALGFQANYANAYFDNIRITMPEGYINTDIKYYPIPSVYEPETNIINPPTVIQRVTNKESLDQLLGEVRPASLILNVNEELNVVDEEGKTIATMDQLLSKIVGKVIPAFNVKDKTTAGNLAKYLKEENVIDFFVLATDGAIIREARRYNPLTRGILSFEFDEEQTELTEQDLIHVRNQTNIAEAYVALIPHRFINNENVRYLQKRLITVWGDLTGEPNTSIYEAIVSGVNGIVAENYEEVFEIYGEFPENSMIRKPFIIGHRGIPSLAPENTIIGTEQAIEYGAEIIELDLHMTRDGEVVVHHDFTTGRLWDKDLNILQSNLEELQALTLKDPNFPTAKISTFEEYMAHFKDEDVVFFVEIKSYDTSIVGKIKNVLEQTGTKDKSVVISFVDSQIEAMNLYFPELSVGALRYAGLVSHRMDTSVESVLHSVVPLQTTFNPSYINLNREFVQAINHRGVTVWPWTINDASIIDYYLMGVGGVTTDTSQYLYDTWTIFKMDHTQFEYIIEEPTKISLSGVMKKPNGQNYPVTPEYVVIDDGGTGITFEKGEVTGAERAGIAKVLVYNRILLPNNEEIVLYDDIITIQVTSLVKDLPNTYNWPIIIGSSIVGVLVLAGAIIIVVGRRKRMK